MFSLCTYVYVRVEQGLTVINYRPAGCVLRSCGVPDDEGVGPIRG